MEVSFINFLPSIAVSAAGESPGVNTLHYDSMSNKRDDIRRCQGCGL